MAIVTFDESTLSCPRLNGYRILPQSRFRRLSVLDGSSRYRLTQPHNSYFVNIVWTFDKEKMKLFRDFYYKSIFNGSDWFLIKLDIGDGMKEYEAHFTEEWTAQPNGSLNWDVAATLEVRSTASHPIEPI